MVFASNFNNFSIARHAGLAEISKYSLSGSAFIACAELHTLVAKRAQISGNKTQASVGLSFLC